MNTFTTVRHIFGPVPSRRLGISLGLDIIPHKTCTLDCLYCECGRTTHQTCQRQRFGEPDAILAELRAALAGIPHLDFISFAGSGEPTLNSDLGLLIHEIKKFAPCRVAVLTNGTLLHLPEVRRDLLETDVVLPSLDTATPAGFQRINHPSGELRIDRIIEGLVSFRGEYKGQIWLEIFFIEGINTVDAEIDALYESIKRIGPDRVQLNTLDRPPAYPGVEAPTLGFLEGLRERWSELPVEIIKRVRRREEVRAFSHDLERNILDTVRRRPLTLDDLTAMTGLPRHQLSPYIDILEKEKKLRPAIVGRNIFYECVEKNEI
jgi:wyosine [tRNA(Phe)-imidazoG37] synthetase (radical SAM superfamily)